MNLKKILLQTVLVLLSTSILFAQTSDIGFSFQGYAIDPDGKALGSEKITVKFSILPGSFIEEHNLQTDAFGVFHAIIGNSSEIKKKEFSEIDFTKKGIIYSLKVEVKKTVGGTYTTISNKPMNAVPYARYAANGVPVGTIVAYGGDKNRVPEGWLLCNGDSQLKSEYPQLYSVIGDAWGQSGSSFNLPDLRGRFLRGVDDGAGVDPDAGSRVAIKTNGNTGDNVGSVQDDVFKGHNHKVTGYTRNDGSHSHSYYSGAGSNAGIKNGGHDGDEIGRKVQSKTTSGGNHQHYIDFDSQSTGGNETRPKNVAVYYIIKY